MCNAMLATHKLDKNEPKGAILCGYEFKYFYLSSNRDVWKLMEREFNWTLMLRRLPFMNRH